MIKTKCEQQNGKGARCDIPRKLLVLLSYTDIQPFKPKWMYQPVTLFRNERISIRNMILEKVAEDQAQKKAEENEKVAAAVAKLNNQNPNGF